MNKKDSMDKAMYNTIYLSKKGGNLDNRVYDALVINTAETTFGNYAWPTSRIAAKLYKSDPKRFGCIFVTGGYSGFATKERKNNISEAEETKDFLTGKCGIDPVNIYTDWRSLESVGNFAFPVVNPLSENPDMKFFDNMMIIGQEGHIWRLKDYAQAVMPKKYNDGKIDFYSVPGEHNNGPMARVYHKGIMNKIKGKSALDILEFLLEEHPFHSEGWFDKSVNRRKAEMALIGGGWAGEAYLKELGKWLGKDVKGLGLK